ncbi:MAG: hypothetical protein IKN63_06900 [Bacilli bacterium]|nr:hypothetical protein [Bacilli bacterium]
MKKIRVLILVLICMFIGVMNVKALSCTYKNGSDTITISIEDINTLRSQYTDSYGTTQVFYPINFANWFNSVNNKVSFGIGGNYEGKSACPKSITTYYKSGDKPFTTYLDVLSTEYEAGYNMNGKKIPIILFSNKGTIISNNTDVNLKIIQTDANYSSIVNTFTSKTTYDLQSTNAQTPQSETNTYIKCDYKNSSYSNSTYTFTFYKGKWDGHGYQVNNSGTFHKLRLDDIVTNSFDSCPSVIKLNESITTFKILDADNCPYDNKLCYYRTDVSPYYSHDAAKSYRYVLISGGTDTLIVSVLKDSTGTLKVTNLADQEITVKNKNNYLSVFKSGTNTPKYLVNYKNGSYEFLKELPKNKDNIVKTYRSSVVGITEVKEEAYKDCKELFGSNFLDWLDANVFMFIRIAVPILLILLTTIDFAKVIFTEDKEGMQNAFKRFIKRAIAAALVFLTPTIIVLIGNLLSVGGDESLEAVNNCVKIIEGLSETSN